MKQEGVRDLSEACVLWKEGCAQLRVKGNGDASVDIVHPVNQVKKSKSDGENDSGPFVDGTDICKVWNLKL